MQQRPPDTCVSAPAKEASVRPGAPTAHIKDIITLHLSTPINIKPLATELLPHHVFTNLLLTGLSQGFRVGISSLPDSTYISNNLQSALKEPDIRFLSWREKSLKAI